MKHHLIYLLTCAFAHPIICMEKPQQTLFEAIVKRNATAVKALLASGTDANQFPNETHTPLSLAITCNSPAQIIDSLLDAGPDLDLSLRRAVIAGWPTTCKKLMRLGANPYAKDAEEKTAFDYLRDTWSYRNEVRQALMKEDTWRGWLRSQLRTVSLCCGCHKHKLE